MNGYKVVHGYEVPNGTSDDAIKALRMLSENGVVRYRYDDGSSRAVAVELIEIADSVGIDTYSDFYELVLFDDHGKLTIDHE